MTTPHRTLQMALDALDAITDDVDGTGLNTMPSFDKALDAITALREALAAPQAEPSDMVIVPRKELGDGISLLHQAMVGACNCLTKTHEARYHAENCFYRKLSDQCDKLEATIAAAPPAAPAVPLTDEQIRSMWKSSEFRGNGGQVDWFCEGIRAAEARHGITGGKP